MKHPTAVLLLACAALLPRAASAQSNGTPPDSSGRSVAHGVYTEAQATQGETAFKANCASCHAPSFHTGEQFRLTWFGRSVFDLFRVLKTTMPEDNVGGLSDDDYTRVIAYILRLNGFPAGTDSLPSDTLALRRLRIGPAAPGAASQQR